MAGRGRGRGRPMLPLGNDQSFGKAEAVPLILHPPPNYPPLEYKPIPTTITSDLNYLLQLKKSFADHMQTSPYTVLPIVIQNDIDRYSDRHKDLSVSEQYDTRYDWSRMPAELRPDTKRKADKAKGLKKKKRKEVDIETKLKELETKESMQQSDVEENGKDEEDEEEKDDEEKLEEEQEDSDEEMDAGTDYANNYFDTGDNNEDEDDNIDEAIM